MDIEFKKTGKNSLGKLSVYTLLLLCIAALGVGSYAAMRSEVAEQQTSETSIDWDNQGGTVEADKPEKPTVEITTKEQTTITEAQTQAREEVDNLPFTGNFTLPLGTQILKDYSDGEMVSSKTMGDWRVHNGIDFTGTKDSKVSAVQKGTVTAVYEDEMWGTVVEIDHGNEMHAKYCGLKKGTTVKQGAQVRSGQAIGELGVVPVEAADEPHLHLEITVNGKIVDPLAAMNRAD